MAQVIWTQPATEEIENIGNYIEEFSEYYASIVVKKLYNEVSLLRVFPLMGRIIPELGEERFRELIRENYRIMYEVIDEDIVLIQRVIHSSMNFKSI